MEKEIKKLVNLMLEAGKAAERQEKGIKDSINKFASERNPVTVMTSGAIIKNVVHAEKLAGTSKLGKEPYTDIVLTLLNNKKVNISAKGTSAPSLAGGGLVALNILAPDLISSFLEKARDSLKAKYKDGEQGVPDVFAKIPEDIAALILAGNEDMGGPIHYMYQGPMDVAATWTGKNKVMLNGVLTSIEDYAKTHKLYLRARKRRIDQPFNSKNLDKSGLPLVFGRSPSKGDVGRRIVITDKVPSEGIIVKI